MVTAGPALTKPGGYVFVGVPYLLGPLAIYHITPGAAAREWLGKPFSPRELTDMFETCGLQVEDQLVYLFRFFFGLLARKPE